MAGVETQTCLWGASQQTGILTTQKKRQRKEYVVSFSFFFFCFSFYLSWLTTSAVAVCSVYPSVLLSLDLHFLFYPDGLFPQVTLSTLFLTPLAPIRFSMHCSCSLYFFSLSTSESVSIPHFVFTLSIELWYPSSEHLYSYKRTPSNVNETRRTDISFYHPIYLEEGQQ